MFKQLLAAAAALALAAPIAAQAQEIPSYAAQSDQQIRGRIANFDGAYSLQVRDDNGYIDNVELHDGTVINPTGLTLEPGMIVSILGDNAGNAFDADEIDTPYNYDDGIPYYGGHRWDYYGPSVDLSFFFGNSGWWHRGGGRYDRGVAYSGSRGNNFGGNRGNNFGGDRGNNFGGNRNESPDRGQQPSHFNAPTRGFQPTPFAPPVRRTMPVNSAPPERLGPPMNASHFSPAGHFSGNPGGTFHSAAPAHESHNTAGPRERR
jgi:hypothetical protein